MAQSQVILHTGMKKLEKSIQSKVLTFILKVQQDDSLTGLDIKIPQNVQDKAVRTARVDKSLRAVMFRLQSSASGMNHYVLVGVYPHDDAYEVASKLSLRVNPINGVTELIENPIADVAAAPVVQDNVPAAGVPVADAPAVEAPEPDEVTEAAATPAEVRTHEQTADDAAVEDAQRSAPGPAVGEKHVGRTLTKVGRDVMVESLGMGESIVDRALTTATVDELLELLAGTTVPEWQADALLDLASGSSADEVALKMSFTPDEDQDTADEPAGEAADDQLIAGLKTDAARLSFAVVEGEDELRAAIEEGDFASWRVFLHPEQRRWAQRDYNGSFRLSGGAGTGKTVVLVHRAVRLARKGQAEQAAGGDSTRILLTTYTKNLADELATQVTTLDSSQKVAEALGDPGIHVAGLDSLAFKVISQASDDEIRQATRDVLGRPRGTQSDLRKNTPDDVWADAVQVADVTLPDRGDGKAFVRAEYERVVLAHRITEKSAYLRVRRPNRGVRLSRGQRGDVWQVMEAYRQRAFIDGTTSFVEKLHIAARILQSRAERIDVPGVPEAERRQAYLVDHVLVDEGQDLSVGHLQLLRALVRKGPNDIFLAEDSHQRIYGQRIVLSHFGITIQGRSRRLTLNYRTTERNLRFGLGILDGTQFGDLFADGGEAEEFTDLEGTPESRAGYRSLRAGVDPVVERYGSDAEELDGIAAYLKAWIDDAKNDPTLKPENLAVLVRTRYVQDSIVRGLAERDVDVRAVNDKGTGKGKPVVLTMHRAKGTEFRNVILARINKGTIPAALTSERYSDEASSDVDQRERSLLYVAATRARDQLVVTGIDR